MSILQTKSLTLSYGNSIVIDEHNGTPNLNHEAP